MNRLPSYTAARMTKGATFARYLLHLTPKSPHTKQAYARTLGAFLALCPNKVTHIRAEHIERYLMSLKCKNSTKNTHLAAIKSFFRWLDDNYDVRNPAKCVDFLPAPPPVQRVITEEEYHRLIVTNPELIKNIIVFLANTGLRSQEFIDLKPDNIGRDFITVNGKGGKTRLVPINSAIKKILPLNLPKNKIALWRLCRKAAYNAGIRPFSAHSLRHYFSNELFKNGIPIPIISKLLGHSSPSVTYKSYIHFSAAELLHSTDCLM